jgi:ribosomal protein S18 acetylase RimI-like enzyme
MMADFRFTNEHGPRGNNDVMQLLRRPRLWIPSHKDYPDFTEWLDKTEARLATNETRAMIGYVGSRPSGVIVYRPHDTLEDTVQIKNISISPENRGRYIGSFLLRNVELEAVQHDYPGRQRVVVDTKATNIGMLDFLLEHSYVVDGVEDIYKLGAGPDIVLKKQISTV